MSDRPTPMCNREQFHRDNGHAREHSIVVSVEFARDLERKLAEANEQLATSADFITTLRCEKEDAEAKLAEARVALEDKRRLDWLQDNQKTVWRALRVEWQATTEADVARRKVTVFEGWVIDDDDPSPTIRGAIDKALARIDKNAGADLPPPAKPESKVSHPGG